MTIMRDESVILRRLLELALASDKSPIWPQLEAAGLVGTVGATYFLLAPSPISQPKPSIGDGVEAFMSIALHRLLQHLTHRTDLRMVDYQGQVRGRIVWPQTYKARYSDNYDPSRIVCREARFQYDTPENQLIKHVVECIQRSLLQIPNVMRLGICYSSNSQNTRTTINRIAVIETALKQYRRNIYMQRVTSVEKLDETHRQRAQLADLDEYREALKLFDFYQNVVVNTSFDVIAECGKQLLPLPGYTELSTDLWLKLGVEILRNPS